MQTSFACIVNRICTIGVVSRGEPNLHVKGEARGQLCVLTTYTCGISFKARITTDWRKHQKTQRSANQAAVWNSAGTTNWVQGTWCRKWRSGPGAGRASYRFLYKWSQEMFTSGPATSGGPHGLGTSRPGPRCGCATPPRRTRSPTAWRLTSGEGLASRTECYSTSTVNFNALQFFTLCHG